jgi:septum formation protein
MKIVLASSSPRREQLLKSLGINFEIIPSTIEEVINPALPPEKLVLDLAKQKAGEVLNRLVGNGQIQDDLLVLGADTLVVLDGAFLGKPADVEQAKSMLRVLSGRWHDVFTGVVIYTQPAAGGERQSYTTVEKSRVLFRDLDEREISSYVDSGEPMDKAGAYALQGLGSAIVAAIEGLPSNIIGLPVPNVVLLLRQAGYQFLGIP